MVIYLVIVVGKLAVNCLNAYGGLMTILTTATAFTKTAHVPQWVRTACIGMFILVSVLIALLASQDFLDNFRNFVLLILMAFTPWSAINLVDYYLISKERVDIPALYDPNGRYGRWNPTALVCYAIGIADPGPVRGAALYTGPLVDDLGGADISWLVGLVVTAVDLLPVGEKDHEPAGADDLPRRRRRRCFLDLPMIHWLRSFSLDRLPAPAYVERSDDADCAAYRRIHHRREVARGAERSESRRRRRPRRR